MKISTFIYLLTLLINQSIARCLLEVHPKIILISDLNSNIFSKIEDCNQQEISSVLRDINRGVKSTQIKNSFELIPATEFIRTAIKHQSAFTPINITISNNVPFLFASLSDHIKVDCYHCNTTGKKSFKVTTGTNRIYWGELTIAEKIKAIYSKENISPGQTLGEMVTVKELLTAEKNRYFDISDINRLKSAIARQKITEGTPLTQQEVIFPPIIRMGDQIQAIVKSQQLELSVGATALENAKWGDKIRLKNNKTQKIIWGKVISAHSVEVFH